MIIFNLLVIALIIAGIWYGIRKYLARNKPKSEQPMLNPFATTKAPEVIRSKFFPDALYVGKTSKLDTSIKYMLTNLLFAFPVDPLIVKEFKYFKIDDNEFEEVIFDKIGVKNYSLLIDHEAETIYFLNRVMSTSIGYDEIVPLMACQDVIELEEGDNKFEYTDVSGLIEVQVYQDGMYNDMLIRVYEREVTEDDNEYLICTQDKPNVINYLLGFHISINQLEDL